MNVRTYGTTGPLVIALHGGPAAVGSAGPVARALGAWFRVLEPWQRGSGDEPLTVARHVEDLSELIADRCDGSGPALVGESWGAMLALAYAAAHPETVGPLVLIGCGTFDPEARAKLQETIASRRTEEMSRRLAEIERDVADESERLRAMYAVQRTLYDYDPVDEAPDDTLPPLDMRAHTETWEDMLRLQSEGVYPAVFRAITSPAIMLHGAYDPHPGWMIHEGLRPLMPQLEYREWEQCGHSPWLERLVRDEFLATMRDWLAAHCEP